MLTMIACRSKYYLSLFQNSSSGTSTNPCFPLRRSYLFTFIVESSSSYKKHQLESTTVIYTHCYYLYWVWMWLDLFYHELKCLVSSWSSGVLCIYVLWFQKGLARYHIVISYHDCFEKVLSAEIYYFCSLVDYAIGMSKCET